MNNLRPFDLGKLDFEKNRKQKRKKLLLYSLPGIVVVILIAIWLLTPTILTSQASTAFEKHDYVKANSKVSGLSFLNLIEPYKAYYNQGTTLSAKGNREAAIEKFETALAYTEDASAVCLITYNLVLTIEGHGDSAVVKSDATEAVSQYTRALNTLKVNKDCFKDEALQKRIEEKLAAAEEAKQRKATTDPNSDNTQDAKPASDSQQQKLKEAEQRGAAARDEQRMEFYDYETLPKGVYPW